MIVACLGYEHVENICKKLGILNISQKLEIFNDKSEDIEAAEWKRSKNEGSF